MLDDELESLAKEVDDEEPVETNGAKAILRAIAIAVLLVLGFIFFCVLTAPVAGGQLICDPPEACEAQLCEAPARCLDVTDPATFSCGTTVPATCADFEASMTRAFIDSEAPGVKAGLLARLRYTVNWKLNSKLDASRIKLLDDLRQWFEAYVIFKDFQPHTPSTGKTVVGYRAAPTDKPDLDLAAAIEAIDKEEQ